MSVTTSTILAIQIMLQQRVADSEWR